MKQFASSAVLALIFLALFVPTTYVPLKAALLLLAFFAITILLFKKELLLNKSTIFACGMMSIVGLINSLHGGFNGNPGAYRVLTVMSAWPIVYAFLSVLLYQRQAVVTLNRVFYITLAVFVLYSFLYLGHEAGFVPDMLYIDIDQGQKSGFYEGYVEYRLYSIASLLFLVPFAIHRAMYLHYRNDLTVRIIFLIGASIVIVFLTGRRAVQLVLVLTPFIIYASHIALQCEFRKSKKTNSMRVIYSLGLYLVGVVAIVFVLNKMGTSMQTLWYVFSDGFDFEAGQSTFERTQQFRSLMNGWLDGNILFGAGNGASVDIIRSEDMVWAYELSYVYLLFSTGIVGVIFYFWWFFWGVMRIKRGLRKNPGLSPYVAPLISGVFGLGIGAASNPYLGKFDYLWLIMLPHLIAGYLKYQKTEEVK